MIKSEIADLQGVNIEYFFSRIPNKPLILFLNGAGRTFDDWDKLVNDLKDEYSIFCFNRLGTGRSSSENEHQTPACVYNLLVKLFEKVIDDYSLEINIITHSLGSVFAQMMAKNGNFEIKSILFIEPTTKDDIDYVIRKRLYICQNTFSETDNIMEYRKPIEELLVCGIPTAVMVGSKKELFEMLNPHRKHHRKCISEFAKVNGSRLVSSSNSKHHIHITDPELVLLTFIAISISI